MEKIINQTNVSFKGWTKRVLIDTPKFIQLIRAEGINFIYGKVNNETLNDACLEALDQGMSQKRMFKLIRQSRKKLFHTNFLWKFFNTHYQLDLQIPLLFGLWSAKPITANTITVVGKKHLMDQVGGTTTAPVTAIALGIGTPAATALGSEITTVGGQRGAATVTNTTTDDTGDTEQWVKTFTFSGSLAITEEALFNNNTSGGIMLASQGFSAINVVDTDTLQFTHKVKAA